MMNKIQGDQPIDPEVNSNGSFLSSNAGAGGIW